MTDALQISAVDFWALTLARALVFVVGGAFATLSYLAYRRNQKGSLLGAVVGFALITLGLAIEYTYAVGVKRSVNLTGTEVARLQTAEGIVIVVGFVVIAYALYRE